MRPTSWQDDETSFTEYGQWLRISDIFNAEEHSLFGNEGIVPGDAVQGSLGDCWIHAAAAAVAQEPQRIRDMFLIKELNSAGIYALKMYLMGIPVTVSVDEFLGFSANDPSGLHYASLPKSKALWMPILEKAAAKLFGNYEMLSGGFMGPAI
jgi:calpain-15